MEALTVTLVEAALRRLWAAMRVAGVTYAEVEHGSFGRIAAEIHEPVAPVVDDDHPLVDATCVCGHDLVTEHNGGGCLHGCDEGKCDGKAAAVSKLERMLFEPIFAARRHSK